MKLFDLLEEIQTALLANKVRSFLTILGIVIGIGSVISMVAIGRGAQLSIEKNIQAIGSNLLMIRPGAQGGFDRPVSSGQGSAETLTREDAEAIAELTEYVSATAPEMSGGRMQVVAKGTNTNTSVSGVTAEYASVRNVLTGRGEFFSNQHDVLRAKVAIVGSETAIDLFGESTDPIGQKIRIKGIDFVVIGVLKTKGASASFSNDDIVYVPLRTMMQYLSGSDALSLINVQVSDQSLMDTADEKITELLLARHGAKSADDADFRIMNQGDIVETASSVTNTFTILLGAVAGISLVVGGIGIMNMMLTTVTERTREIGLRKALGAKRRDISLQFLLESVALTVFGGIIGIALGFGLAFAVTRYLGISAEVTPASIALAFGVSSLIGIAFGYYPARRASKMSPIEALRYE